MYKNLTIRQISVYISLAVCLGQVLTFVALFYQEIKDVPLWKISLLAFVSLAFSYAIVVFLVERYFFRRIKLIYKIISGSKDSLKDTEGLSKSSSFQSINQKVEEWTNQTQEELTSLKSLEAYRHRYLGDVSHELKTPLFTIQGYLYTLLEGGLYDEKINKKYVTRAIQNVERLQDIVEDLELINELESEDYDKLHIAFDLKDLTDEVFSDLELKAAERRIRFEYKSGADTSFKVVGDKNQIRQVFNNLISNSIKYGKEGGRTRISFYDLHQKILIEVSDDGVGIEESDQKRVFDRFYRADKSRSRRIDGSGLGLAIVKHILEAHNQKITLRSTVGKGSTFGFTLDKGK